MYALNIIFETPLIKAKESATDEFSELYDKYKRPLHTYIYRLLGSQEDAEDQRFELGNEEEASYLPTNNGGIPEIFEREHIRLALDSIPAEYAAILLLNTAQGISYLDIATIMEITPYAAATRLSRAKRMFTQQYQRLKKE